MTKVESCIVYKQQAQKSDVIFVDKTDSDDFSFSDCEDNSSSENDAITVNSAYFSSMEGL